MGFFWVFLFYIKITGREGPGFLGSTHLNSFGRVSFSKEARKCGSGLSSLFLSLCVLHLCENCEVRERGIQEEQSPPTSVLGHRLWGPHTSAGGALLPLFDFLHGTHTDSVGEGSYSPLFSWRKGGTYKVLKESPKRVKKQRKKRERERRLQKSSLSLSLSLSFLVLPHCHIQKENSIALFF